MRRKACQWAVEDGTFLGERDLFKASWNMLSQHWKTLAAVVSALKVRNIFSWSIGLELWLTFSFFAHKSDTCWVCSMCVRYPLAMMLFLAILGNQKIFPFFNCSLWLSCENLSNFEMYYFEDWMIAFQSAKYVVSASIWDMLKTG